MGCEMTNIDPIPYIKNKLYNFFHTILLLGAMLVLLSLLGWIISGASGVMLLAVAGILFFLFSPHISPQFIMRMYRATPLSPYEAAGLYAIVEELTRRAGLGYIPALYYVPTQILNAFSVGTRERAAIGVTDGLLRNLNRREITAVLAHEISHIAHNDVRVMAMADMISRTTHLLSMFGQILLLFNFPLLLLGEYTIPWLFILLLIFAPTVSALLQLALSRTREYDADLDAVRLTGDPRGLASALAKMEELQSGVWERIFLPGRRVPHPSLLRTHPNTEERIKRLLELEAEYPAGQVYPSDILEEEFSGGVPFPERNPRRPRWHVTGLWY